MLEMPFSHSSRGLSTSSGVGRLAKDYLATSGNGLMFSVNPMNFLALYEFGRTGFDRYPVDYSGLFGARKLPSSRAEFVRR